MVYYLYNNIIYSTIIYSFFLYLYLCLANYTNIQVHNSFLNIMKQVNIFCHSFQKVKPINYVDSLHIEWNISSL